MMGLAISNLWIGTIGGVLIGFILGYLMENKEK
jgi:hypothetical protein